MFYKVGKFNKLAVNYYSMWYCDSKLTQSDIQSTLNHMTLGHFSGLGRLCCTSHLGKELA